MVIIDAMWAVQLSWMRDNILLRNDSSTVSPQRDFILAKDPNPKCLFKSCLFTRISLINLTSWFLSDALMIIWPCCFSTFVFCSINGTELNLSGASCLYLLTRQLAQIISLGMTICRCFRRVDLFFNNNSDLASIMDRSCYFLVRSPVNREDTSCFFSWTCWMDYTQ